MTGVLCILLPFALAALLPWTRWAHRLSLGCAVLHLLLAVSLPWTGSAAGGWLLSDPLGVHILVLTGFAWLMASALAPTTPSTAVLIGSLTLALLSDGAGLTVAALGGAGLATVFCLRPAEPGPLLAAAAAGAALAVFGSVLLYAGAVPALGRGWVALSWSALPEAGGRANGMAWSAGFVLILLGSAISCGLVLMAAALRVAALPPGLLMLAGPLGGAWLVVALRLRGVLDGSGHAIAPGGVLLAMGLAGLAVALVCLRSREAVVPAACLAMVAAVTVGFGIGGAAVTEAGLLHLTLGCVALTAAATGSRMGVASLAGLPPLGVFASGFALVAGAAGRAAPAAVLLGLALFGVAALALRSLPPAGRGPRLGWVGVGLTLAGAWAMPPAISAWLQGIAAAAR